MVLLISVGVVGVFVLAPFLPFLELPLAVILLTVFTKLLIMELKRVNLLKQSVDVACEGSLPAGAWFVLRGLLSAGVVVAASGYQANTFVGGA